MSKVYTFPTQETLSGTMVVQITTSSGSGTETLTDKYFSDESSIAFDTEFLGGDLLSPYADLTVDYDKNDLFKSTILPDVNSEDGYALVKISLDGEPKFYGVIEPSTVAKIPFHAENDSQDGQKNSITFRIIWVFMLAKRISKSDLANRLLTVAQQNNQYFTSDGNWTSTGYSYVSLRDIINAVLYLMNSNYGFTYTVSFSLTDVLFFSKGDGSAASTPYNFPYIANAGIVDFSSFGASVEPSLIHGKISATPSAGSLTVAAESGTLFYDSNDTTFENAYDFFVGILKSFGMYCKITHSTTVDLIVDIGTRVSGIQVNLSDVLTAEEIPFSELSRSSMDIKSLQSGNSYEKVFNNLGTSQFSAQLPLDFGNDLDFPGGLDPVNSIKSLVFPIQNVVPNPITGLRQPHFQLIREIGLGENKLLNSQFTTNLDNWAAGGTWVWSNTDIYEMSGGSARVTLNTLVAQEITQTLSVESYDGLIFGGWFKANYDGGTGVTIIIRFYDGATVISSESFSIDTINNWFLIYSVIRAGVVRRNKGVTITKVGVSVNPGVAGTASQYLYMDRTFCYRNRFGTPQLVGMQVEDYFNDGILTRQKHTLNGRNENTMPGNYYLSGLTKFYIKKNKWSFRNYETDIEAINYPY